MTKNTELAQIKTQYQDKISGNDNYQNSINNDIDNKNNKINDLNSKIDNLE